MKNIHDFVQQEVLVVEKEHSVENKKYYLAPTYWEKEELLNDGNGVIDDSDDVICNVKLGRKSTSMHVRVKVNGIELLALTDSGGEVTIIPYRTWKKVTHGVTQPMLRPVQNVEILDFTGKRKKGIRGSSILVVQFGDVEVTTEVLVIDDMNEEMLLGLDFLSQLDAIISFENKTITIKTQSESAVLDMLPVAISDQHAINRITWRSEKQVTSNKDDVLYQSKSDSELWQVVNKANSIDDKQKQMLFEVLQRNSNVFSDKPGCCKNFVAKDFVNSLADLGIKVIHTSPYHAKCNLVERAHAELNRLFRVICGEKNKDWIKRVGEIVYFLNHTLSTNIGVCPAEIFMNDKDIQSIEKHFGVMIEGQEEKYDVSNLLTMVEIKRKKNAERVRQKEAIKHEQRRKIKKGDLVFVLQYNLSSTIKQRVGKYTNVYRGPYFCGRQKGNKTFELWNAVNGEYYGFANVENLKVWLPTPETRKRWVNKIQNLVDLDILPELKVECNIEMSNKSEKRKEDSKALVLNDEADM